MAGADSRRVQKLPAGVLIVHRGLIFVKQRRNRPQIAKIGLFAIDGTDTRS